MKLKTKWHWRHKWSNWSDAVWKGPIEHRNGYQYRICQVCNKMEEYKV